MVIPKLAYRNIIGRGVRTWLNVLVLSLAFVVIIGLQGLLSGWNKQAITDMVEIELGGGQFWHKAYDRYDPMTLEDSHAPLPESLADLVAGGKATPILIASGAIFPQRRVQSALLKGIDPDQQILGIPSRVLKSVDPDVIPGLIGARMARQTKLGVGDYVTVRWRDAFGTFDAADIMIAEIMTTNVSSVDAGQIWLPLDKLRQMLRMPGEATLVTLGQDIESPPPAGAAWVYRDLDYLVKEFRTLIEAKSIGSSVFYIILLAMGLLAIFDTQVLSVFRRRREIGTLMAMGMVRTRVIGLFTLEGALHGALALIVGAVYGIPLLIYFARVGFSMPAAADNMGIAIASTLYPSYGLKLLLGTVILVLATVTIVSFLPTRRIAKLKPTDALRGKMS